MSLNLVEQNEEVFFALDTVVPVDKAEIDRLKDRAASNQRKKVRLCAHQKVEDSVHEMLIVHSRDTYVRPHKHMHNSESLHVIEGSADLVIFDEEGNIASLYKMGDYASGLRFYYRASGPCWHTLLITSDVLVFHEAKEGPLNESDTIWAPWAPSQDAGPAAEEYSAQLTLAVARFGSKDDQSFSG